MVVYYIKNGISFIKTLEKISISFEALWELIKSYVQLIYSKLPEKEEVRIFVMTNWKTYIIVISGE